MKRTFLHVLSSAISNSHPEQLCSAFLCLCETPGAGSRFICRGETVKFLHPPSPEMCPSSMGFGACGTRGRASCNSAVPHYHSAGVSFSNRRCPTAACNRRSDLLCSQRIQGLREVTGSPCLEILWIQWNKVLRNLIQTGSSPSRIIDHQIALPTAIIVQFCDLFSCVTALSLIHI